MPFEKLGPYELVERLAVGGMAEIYVARARGVQGFEKEYVLKLIHPKYVGDHEFIRMLVDEAKLVGALTHPNVAQVIDLGVDGESYYILMEYVRGKDLYQVLHEAWDRGFNLPISMCLNLARDVCAGLYYAHHKCDETHRPLNIVHRDVSPQNVIVSFNGEAKLVDFGVAKAALGARPETRAGIIKGKFRYMSPEQAWGEKLDGRSDLFSVGLCLYEMVCGEPAYADDDGDMQRMLTKMREADFVPPSRHRPEVDAELEAIMMKALARDRADRYPTCHAFEVALATYQHTRFPSFTRLDITGVMKELYPEDTLNVHVPEPTERTMGFDGIEVGTDELIAMGFVEVHEEQETDTDDLTLRQSILRGPAAGNEAPDDSFADEETDFYLQPEEDDATSLDLRGLQGETRSMPSNDLHDLIADDQETVDLPSFRLQQRNSFATPVGPFGDEPLTIDETSPRRTTNPRKDTVAALIEKHLPPPAASRALGLHQWLAEALESEQGRNYLVVILGVTLGLFLLLVLVIVIL